MNAARPEMTREPWWVRRVDAMCSREGVMTTLVVACVVTYAVFQWKYSAKNSEAEIAKDKATASAMDVVASAVTKLAVLAEKNEEAMERVKLEHKAFADSFGEAKEMMRGAPARGEKMLQLQQEMVDELKALRKNVPAAPATGPTATTGGSTESRG